MYDEWKKIPSEDIALTSVHDITIADVTCGRAESLGEIRGDSRKPFGTITVSGIRADHVAGANAWRVSNAPAFKDVGK